MLSRKWQESQEITITFNTINESLFESIRHINEDGQEYWTARELQTVLDYKRWDKFLHIIDKAKKACEGSDNTVSDHFSQVGKMIDLAKGTIREVEDFQHSGYYANNLL